MLIYKFINYVFINLSMHAVVNKRNNKLRIPFLLSPLNSAPFKQRLKKKLEWNLKKQKTEIINERNVETNIDNKITNLTNLEIDHETVKLLSKGPKFNLPNSLTNNTIIKIKGSFMALSNQIKWLEKINEDKKLNLNESDTSKFMSDCPFLRRPLPPPDVTDNLKTKMLKLSVEFTNIIEEEKKILKIY